MTGTEPAILSPRVKVSSQSGYSDQAREKKDESVSSEDGNFTLPFINQYLKTASHP